jgi:hypothetical protein
VVRFCEVAARRTTKPKPDPRGANSYSKPFDPRRHERSDDADAFIPTSGKAPDDLAERLGEQFVESATTGVLDADGLDAAVPEEIGGPFVETEGSEELADGADESNPPDAEVEALPHPMAGLITQTHEDLPDQIDAILAGESAERDEGT